MRLFRLLPLLALLLAAFAAASCGGGTGSPADAGQDSGLSAAQWAAMNHGAAPPSSSGLPSFPYDNSGVRSASDAGGTVLGANFLLSDRCVVDGDSLHINVAGDNPGMGGEDMGWAMYRISGLSGQRALSLNVECLPDSLGNQYYVGVANYTHLSWDWYGPVEIPEAQIDLAQDNAAYISNLGNLYFVIACYGGSSATHSQSTVVTGNGGGGLPGAPAGLFASKGEFPDGVQLTWGPGVNAAWYEVERRDPNGDANNGMPGGQWMQIGIAQDSSWFDPNLPAGVMFEYRVRSVNAAGVSDYSNTDFGFAYGGPPPGGDYAL